MLLKLIRALLVASVIVPVVAFGLFAWHSHKEYVRGAQDRAQRLASVVQEHTLKVFETIGLVLHAADQKLDGATWDEMPPRRLWDDLKAEQSSEQVGDLRDQSRRFRAVHHPPVSISVVDFSDRDYYVEQRRADRGVYIGQPMWARSPRPDLQLQHSPHQR